MASARALSGLAASSSAPPGRSSCRAIAGEASFRAASGTAPAARARDHNCFATSVLFACGGGVSLGWPRAVGALPAAAGASPATPGRGRSGVAVARAAAASAGGPSAGVGFSGLSPSGAVHSSSTTCLRSLVIVGATKAGRSSSGGKKGGHRGGAEEGAKGGGEGSEAVGGGFAEESEEGSVRSRALERLRRSKLRSAAMAVEQAASGRAQRAGRDLGLEAMGEVAEDDGELEAVDGPLVAGVVNGMSGTLPGHQGSSNSSSTEAPGARGARGAGASDVAFASSSSSTSASSLSPSSSRSSRASSSRRRSRRFAEALARSPGRGVLLSPREAVSLALSLCSTRFAESVEVHARVGLDPRRADQQLRGVAELPHGSGKRKNVWVLCEEIEPGGLEEVMGADGGGDLKWATTTISSSSPASSSSSSSSASPPPSPPPSPTHELFMSRGAVRAGGDDLVSVLSSSPPASLLSSIDAIVATRAFVPRLAKLGRLLGPRGLMPSPKTGTVVSGPREALAALAAIQRGRVAFRLDRASCVHAAVARADLGEERVLENLLAFLRSVEKQRPKGAAGGNLWKKISIATTMGPGIGLDVERIRDA